MLDNRSHEFPMKYCKIKLTTLWSVISNDGATAWVIAENFRYWRQLRLQFRFKSRERRREKSHVLLRQTFYQFQRIAFQNPNVDANASANKIASIKCKNGNGLFNLKMPLKFAKQLRAFSSHSFSYSLRTEYLYFNFSYFVFMNWIRYCYHNSL